MLFYAQNGDFRAGGNLGPGIGNINLSAADSNGAGSVSQNLERRPRSLGTGAF